MRSHALTRNTTITRMPRCSCKPAHNEKPRWAANGQRKPNSDVLNVFTVPVLNIHGPARVLPCAKCHYPSIRFSTSRRSETGRRKITRTTKVRSSCRAILFNEDELQEDLLRGCLSWMLLWTSACQTLTFRLHLDQKPVRTALSGTLFWIEGDHGLPQPDLLFADATKCNRL